MTKLQVTPRGLQGTLDYLQRSGQQGNEGVVLWLGPRTSPFAQITHVYQPLHHAAADFFHIPKEGMTALLEYLDQHSVGVLAQVHTHPADAFHSAADNKWALVRHLGALSLVLPYFARGVRATTFLSQAATYQLDSRNRWVQVRPDELNLHLEVTE